jgi:hypothetical protein
VLTAALEKEPVAALQPRDDDPAFDVIDEATFASFLTNHRSAQLAYTEVLLGGD